MGGPYYTGIDLLDIERRNFGAWDGPAPTGFAVDPETRWLTVDRDAFDAVREGVERLDEGEATERVAADVRMDRDALAKYYERRSLYLNGTADHERVEAAFAEAGIEAEFDY